MTEVLVVSDAARGRYLQRIEAGVHRFVADEPEPVGNDLGPDPYALLLSALGACTAMTLRMYADQKKWSLDGVTVRLRYGRIHVEDCKDCESTTGRVHRIECELELEGDLSDAERERLLEIAKRCAVHRTLVEEKEILTTLTRT